MPPEGYVSKLYIPKDGISTDVSNCTDVGFRYYQKGYNDGKLDLNNISSENLNEIEYTDKNFLNYFSSVIDATIKPYKIISPSSSQNQSIDLMVIFQDFLKHKCADREYYDICGNRAEIRAFFLY